MREEIKIKERTEDELINAVIELEWDMFDKVNNIGGVRASCQDDERAFYINRYSQHSALGQETVFSYYNDIKRAAEEGRNIITEKYAYMMEYTDPEYYRTSLKEALPSVSEEKAELIERIIDIQLRQEMEFRASYPYFAGSGRPIDGSGSAFTSFKVYSTGELKTYSERTLRLFLRDIELTDAGSAQETLSYKIHFNTARLYGYLSVDDAENALKNARR